VAVLPEPVDAEREALIVAIAAELDDANRPRHPGPAAGSPAAGPLAPLPPLHRAGWEAAPQSTADAAVVPPQSIQRVVRLHHGELRGCYLDGLRRRPELAGRMVLRFVIGEGGAIGELEEEQATLDDRETRECVLLAFFALRFPDPAGQRVVVRYPIAFTTETATPPVPLTPPRQTAERAPAGFAEAMAAGVPVSGAAPPTVEVEVPPPPPARPSSCPAGDPLCSDL
jgi:hypothetical protein